MRGADYTDEDVRQLTCRTHVIKILAPLVFGSVASSFGMPVIFWINALMLAGGGIISRTRSLQ
jgi:hypothetical protein